MKRIFDFIFSLCLLIFLSPLLLFISFLVSLDGGPVLFLQQRVGLGGKLFYILKFRSMNVAKHPGLLLTVGKDKRITRVGIFLRHFKLDELPQLINVLLGDMSLVGPRPEVPKYVELYPDPLREIVLSVRPGITCPSSISFIRESQDLAKAKDPEDYYINYILPKKVDGYVKYVRSMSFLSDLKCILSTFLSLLA